MLHRTRITTAVAAAVLAVGALIGLGATAAQAAEAPVTIVSPVTGSTVPTVTPTLTGTGQPGANVIIESELGVYLCSTTVDPSGEWSCTLTDPLPAGPVTLWADQRIPGGGGTNDGVTIEAVPVVDGRVVGGIALAGVAGLACAGLVVVRRRAARRVSAARGTAS